MWGYLIPADDKFGDVLVLKKRAACPVPKKKQPRKHNGRGHVQKDTFEKEEQEYEKAKAEDGVPAGGFLIGRHPECGE